jgi:hypothetical protein
MCFLVPAIVLVGSIVGPPASPAAALSLPELSPAREAPLSGFPPVFATFRLAASAYKAPSADTVTPPPAEATGTTTRATTTSTTSTTTPATPAATSETGNSGSEPSATPNPNAYKPPSVEIAPGGITIYRGSGSP